MNAGNHHQVIAEGLKKWAVKKIVLDPVMVAETGSLLLDKESCFCTGRISISLVDIRNANLYEVSVLLKREINTVEEMEEAAHELYSLGFQISLN